MQFSKKLRERVKSGEITTSIRIWKNARVKVGDKYLLEGGKVVVTSIREITFEDISEMMARESGLTHWLDEHFSPYSNQ